MKKLFLIFLVGIQLKSYAQWSTAGGLNTSTVSTGGAVGIGIASPSTKLQVSAGFLNDNSAIRVENDFARPSMIFSKNRNDYFPNVNTTWMVYPAGISNSSSASNFRILSLTNGIYRTPFSINSSNGHIGIGNEAPESFLHITATAANENAALNIENDFARPSLVFKKNRNDYFPNVSTTWMIYPAGISASSTESIFRISSNTNGSTSSPLAIKSSNGYVGIGTENPTSKLEVSHCGGQAEPTLKLINCGGMGKALEILAGANQPDYSIVDVKSYANQNYFSILGNGKISIGNVTTPGNYLLYVEKGILTEEVKVALKSSTAWADYVFNKDYKLKSLQEVEEFIQENKHLPNVPSAEELMNNGGVNVSSMMSKQMEKIEELTLYIIEQNKKLEKLQAQVNKLQNN